MKLQDLIEDLVKFRDLGPDTEVAVKLIGEPDYEMEDGDIIEIDGDVGVEYDASAHKILLSILAPRDAD